MMGQPLTGQVGCWTIIASRTDVADPARAGQVLNPVFGIRCRDVVVTVSRVIGHQSHAVGAQDENGELITGYEAVRTVQSIAATESANLCCELYVPG